MTSPNALADEIARRSHSARRTRDPNLGLLFLDECEEVIAALRSASSLAPEVTGREAAAQAILARIRKVRDGYASQAKFADVDQASYFREFVRRLDDAVKEHRPATTRDEEDADVRHLAWEMWCRDQPGCIWTMDNKRHYRKLAIEELSHRDAAPDPSGQVDRAAAGIDADVGVPRGDPHRFAVVSSDYSRPFLLGAYATLAAAQLAQCGNPGRWPIYERFAAPTPPSPKGGNEIGKGGNEPDPFAGADPSRYSGSPSYGDCPNPPDAECDSASGAQGLAELNAEATPGPWRHENTAFSSYLLAGGVGWVSEAPLEAEYWRGGADKSSAVKNHLFILALVNAYRSGSLVSGDTLAALKARVTELEAGLRDLETACDRRAAATSREMYLALSSTEGMLRALTEIDAARSNARALLSGGSDGS